MEQTMEEKLKIIQENIVSKMKDLGLPTTTCKVTDIRCGIASVIADHYGITYYAKHQKDQLGLDEYLEIINKNFSEEIICLQNLIADYCKDQDFIKTAKEDIDNGNTEEFITPESYICEMILASFVCGNIDCNWCTSCEDFAVNKESTAE